MTGAAAFAFVRHGAHAVQAPFWIHVSAHSAVQAQGSQAAFSTHAAPHPACFAIFLFAAPAGMYAARLSPITAKTAISVLMGFLSLPAVRAVHTRHPGIRALPHVADHLQQRRPFGQRDDGQHGDVQGAQRDTGIRHLFSGP